MRPALLAGCCVAFVGVTSPSWARPLEECQLAWGQAARSYLSGKGGPQDADFKAACEMEAKGEKEAARVEAVMVATAALVKENAESCERFLKSYVGVGDPAAVCGAAGGEDAAAFRKAVGDNLPPPGKGKPAGKKKK